LKALSPSPHPSTLRQLYGAIPGNRKFFRKEKEKRTQRGGERRVEKHVKEKVYSPCAKCLPVHKRGTGRWDAAVPVQVFVTVKPVLRHLINVRL